MDVRLFKLTNGQELVAEYVGQEQGSITVKRPLVVHMMRDQQGNPTLGFGEWSVLMEQDQNITINAHALLTPPLTLLPEIVQSYEQQMSTLILPPAASKILHG